MLARDKRLGKCSKAGAICCFYRANFINKNFSGNWRVGLGTRGIKQFEPDEKTGDHEAVSFIPRNASDIPTGWTYAVIGTVTVKQAQDVEFHFLGGNSSWTGRILFDYVGLVPLGVPWEIKRSILLGMIKGNMLHNPCLFSKLSSAVVLEIFRFV